MVSMNTAKVKEITGLTDDQISYLIKKVDVLKREKTQGKARDYSFRDVVFLKLASIMRHDRISLKEINGAFKLLDRHWVNTELPPFGWLERDRKDNIVTWGWRPNTMLEQIIGTNADGENITESVTHMPRYIYVPNVFAKELSKGDQLELELDLNVMSEEMAVN